MAREYIPKSPYIRTEVWKRITSVIRDYNALRAEYKAFIKDTASDTETHLKELERKISAVDKALNSFDSEVKELVRQRYWKGKTYRDILVPMSESTMKRYVRKFVVEVGRNLGEIK